MRTLLFGTSLFFVMVIYLPANYQTSPKFDTILTDVLTRFSADDCVFLVGDFILDTSSYSNQEINSVNNLMSHSFVHIINLSSKSTACLDHIWNYKMLECTPCILSIDITDHSLILITFLVVTVNRHSKDPSLIMLVPSMYWTILNYSLNCYSQFTILDCCLYRLI